MPGSFQWPIRKGSTMDKLTRDALSLRTRMAVSTRWRTLWRCSRAALLWLVSIVLASVVYLLYVITCGAGALRRREARITKRLVRAATLCATTLAVTCIAVEKCAGAAYRWLCKKTGLPNLFD